MKPLFSVYFFLSSIGLFSQKSETFLHTGIWMNAKNIHQFTLLKIEDKRLLLIQKTRHSMKAEVYFYGYLSHNRRPVTQEELKPSGLYFVVLDETILAKENQCKPNLDLFTYDQNTLAYNNPNGQKSPNGKPIPLELKKIQLDSYDITSLPQYVWKVLFDLSQQDKRNYLTEFFKLDFYKVTGRKTFFYNQPNKRSHHKMRQGFVVQHDPSVHDNQFVKVKFYTNQKRLHNKWLSREDVSPLLIPTFACLYAKTLIEKTICKHQDLSRLDGELAYLYRNLKSYAHVVQSQKKWNTQQSQVTPPFVYDKLLDLYNRRLSELTYIYNHSSNL